MFAGIANLPEDTLRKLSGSPHRLGAGKEGQVVRHCEDMPHPEYIVSAVRFVAVKEHRSPVQAAVADAALVKLAALVGDGRSHVLSARPAITIGREAAQLAHTTLREFLQNDSLSCSDALVMVRDLSLGLDSLHAAEICHGDLAPRNVLVGPGGYIVSDINGDPLDDFSKHLDMVHLSRSLSNIFFGVEGAEMHTISGYPKIRWDISTRISDELARAGVDRSRLDRVLSRFDEMLSNLESAIFDRVTLISLASMADELNVALRRSLRLDGGAV